MSFLWDSNILRHYLDDHPRLLQNLKKVPRQHVLLPIIVVAEQIRGRSDAILKAEPGQLVRMQEFLGRHRIYWEDFRSCTLMKKH